VVSKEVLQLSFLRKHSLKELFSHVVAKMAVNILSHYRVVANITVVTFHHHGVAKTCFITFSHYLSVARVVPSSDGPNTGTQNIFIAYLHDSLISEHLSTSPQQPPGRLLLEGTLVLSFT
jgi:hypothetical protein